MFLGEVGFYRRLIVCECILFDEADRAGWTGRQSVALTIAVIVAQQLGLAVYHADRALMAGLGSETAAVAFLFVDLNNSSFHMVSLRLVFCFGLFDFMGTIYYNRTMQSVVFTTK